VRLEASSDERGDHLGQVKTSTVTAVIVVSIHVKDLFALD
jgi:hypothetical protein